MLACGLVAVCAGSSPAGADAARVRTETQLRRAWADEEPPQIECNEDAGGEDTEE